MAFSFHSSPYASSSSIGNAFQPFPASTSPITLPPPPPHDPPTLPPPPSIPKEPHALSRFFRLKSKPICISVHPHRDSGIIAVLDDDGMISIWDDKGQKIHEWEADPSAICLTISSDDRLYWIGGDRFVFCHDLKSGNLLFFFDAFHRYSSRADEYEKRVARMKARGNSPDWDGAEKSLHEAWTITSAGRFLFIGTGSSLYHIHIYSLDGIFIRKFQLRHYLHPSRTLSMNSHGAIVVGRIIQSGQNINRSISKHDMMDIDSSSSASSSSISALAPSTVTPLASIVSTVSNQSDNDNDVGKNIHSTDNNNNNSESNNEKRESVDRDRIIAAFTIQSHYDELMKNRDRAMRSALDHRDGNGESKEESGEEFEIYWAYECYVYVIDMQGNYLRTLYHPFVPMIETFDCHLIWACTMCIHDQYLYVVDGCRLFVFDRSCHLRGFNACVGYIELTDYPYANIDRSETTIAFHPILNRIIMARQGKKKDLALI